MISANSRTRSPWPGPSHQRSNAVHSQSPYGVGLAAPTRAGGGLAQLACGRRKSSMGGPIARRLR